MLPKKMITMSDNYNDKDIEKLIFGGGLGNGAIEPSERFWKKAYEDILQRENSTNLKRISGWRNAFYAMTTASLILASYIIYMHIEVNSIQQQITKIESTPVNTSQQSASQNALSNTTENRSVSTEVSTRSQSNNGKQHNETAIASATGIFTNTNNKQNRRTYSVYTNSSAGVKASSMPQIIAANSTIHNINSPTPALNSQTTVINNAGRPSPSVENISSVANTPQPGINNSTSALNKKSNNELIAEATKTPITGTNTPLTNNANSSQKTGSDIQNSKVALTNKKTDSAAKTSILDSTNSIYTPKKQITLAGILSKLSVSAFYAPGITEDFLNDKNNDPTNTITATGLKTQQDGDGTYAIGLHLAYDISNRWSIQAGVYYSQYTYNIKPTIIYPQQEENGQVGYAVTTSSGTVFLPNSAVPAHIGDSIKVNGNSGRGYIGIPLQVKYKFVAGTRFNFYIDGGLCLNIAKDMQTTIHWENTALQEGDLTLESIYGLNSIQYCYNFGFGASYLIGKGLSIYTEPFMNGSFTSVNKNAPVIIYPYFFGLAVGLTYHF